MPTAETVRDESHGKIVKGELSAEDLAKLKNKYLPDLPILTPTQSNLPGMGNYPIGIQSRLRDIFWDGKTVMLACDHPYLLNDRLPRLDQRVGAAGLLDGIDCLMCTKGTRMRDIPADFSKPLCIRVGASPGLKILGRRALPDVVTEKMFASGRHAAEEAIRNEIVNTKEWQETPEDKRDELLARKITTIDQDIVEKYLARILADRDLPDEIETAGKWVLKLNASMMAVQLYPGSEYYKHNLETLQRVIEFGEEYDIPVMAVTAVGTNMARSGDFFRDAIATIATMGAHVIKTYYTNDAEFTVLSAGIPLVMAGGSKGSELQTLESVERWMQKGGCGVDMGRNIIEAANPKQMLAAVSSIVHEGRTAEIAHKLYENRSFED